jgi:hypothetical protein
MRGGRNLQLEDNASDALRSLLVLEGLEGDLEETLATRFGRDRTAGSEEVLEALIRPEGQGMSVP